MENSFRLAPFVRFLIPFCIGIVFQIHSYWIRSKFEIVFLLSVSVIFAGLMLANRIRHRPLFPILIGACAYFFLFILGGITAHQYDWSKQNNFIGNYSSANAYKGVISSDIQFASKTVKCILDVTEVKQNLVWRPVRGKVLLYMDTTFSKVNKISYGDELLIAGFPDFTKPPKNPGEFDYKRYLSYSNIFHRDYINGKKAFKVDEHKGNIIISFAVMSRDFSGGIIREFIHSSREVSILSALVLGVRGELDDETLQAYVSAGAMHVLSVSGLHVALVFQLLTWVLGFIQFDKIGKWFYYAISLLLIWGYAILTGLCPSVMRSVVMFSVILIGQATNKNNNTFNSIGFSAFLLLLYNPFMLLDVGFQLSYLAVLGIVYLQPKIYSWFEIKNGIGDWAWQITSVSIAAQLITFPLSILYFHQFPTYFLLTNIIVIPASTAMLYGGLGLFGVYWIPYISTGYGYVLEKFTWLVNEYLVWNLQLPGSVIDGIYIEKWEAWLMFAIMGLAMLTMQRKRFYYIPLIFLFALALCFQAGKRKFESTSHQQFYVYHIPKGTAIEWIDSRKSILLTDLEPDNYQGKFKFHIRNNHIHHGVENVHFMPIDFQGKQYPCGYSTTRYTVFVRYGKTILVIKKPISMIDALVDVLKPDLVIFTRNSLKGNLKFNPMLSNGTKYIADGSNAEYFNKEVLEKYPLIYLTSELGCFQD